MISRGLCGVIALEALVLHTALATLLGAQTLTPRVALAAAAAVLLLNAGIFIALYAILRRYAAKFSSKVGPRAAHTWGCAIGELLALFTTFVVLQPFERVWMGTDKVGELRPGRVPILLVHGYLCNRALWWWLRRRLRARQFAVATVNLEPPLAGLDELAERLAERIDAFLAETGAQKVALVTHSMGGLVSRAYLQEHGATHIAKLITVAAPHQGTQIARLGFGRNSREMQPENQWLRSMNAQPPLPVPSASIWSQDDEFLAPPEAGRLPLAREHVLRGLGHLALAFSPAVLAIIEAEFAQEIDPAENYPHAPVPGEVR